LQFGAEAAAYTLYCNVSPKFAFHSLLQILLLRTIVSLLRADRRYRVVS